MEVVFECKMSFGWTEKMKISSVNPCTHLSTCQPPIYFPIEALLIKAMFPTHRPESNPRLRRTTLHVSIHSLSVL